MQITESAQNSKMEKVEQEHFFTAILNGAVKYLKAIQKISIYRRSFAYKDEGFGLH